MSEKLRAKLGNPGIWGYCKESEYDDFMKQLDERGYFHDLGRSNGELLLTPFNEFQYADSITESDFSHIPYKEDEKVVHVWCVEKKYQNELL